MQFTTGILEMVRANLGISFLTNWVVGRYASDELVCKKLGRDGLFRNWHVSRSATMDAPWLEAFICLLKAEHPMPIKKPGPISWHPVLYNS